MLGQKFLADARLVIEAVQRSLGNDLHQVAITLIVLGQHDEVVVGVALGRGAMVFLLADVELAAEDRLHARFFGGVHERHRAEDVAVIGHGDRRHLQLLDAADQALDLASAVEHGEVGMKMEMNEFGLRHRCFYFMRSVRRLRPEEGVEKGCLIQINNNLNQQNRCHPERRSALPFARRSRGTPFAAKIVRELAVPHEFTNQVQHRTKVLRWKRESTSS